MPLKGRGRNYGVARGVVEGLLARAYGNGWPSRLPGARSRVVRVDRSFEAPGLSGPLRVGFASDLHAGPTTPEATLDEAFAHLRDFRPDVLLLGGDFVLFDAAHVERLVPRITATPAPLGRYAVLGNHDLWADHRFLVRCLERAGVEVLVNRTVQLPSVRVSVGGLDDAWTGSPDYDEAFRAPCATHLVLMHGPDHAPALERFRFTLALCGHTHGGHLALPGGTPLHIPTRVARNYPAGLFTLPGGKLWVSRGVGHVEVPLRTFAPPDVLCATLVPSA